MSRVYCACDCKVICIFAGSTVMSICKFYSIMTCLNVLCDCKVVCVFARCTIKSICNFYSIMTCLGCPVNVIARWSVSLLGAQSCQLVSSTQSWHVWVPCACDCKIVCVFAGSTVMSIYKFCSIMKCPACPVAAIARWSVSLLGAQPCQFLSSTQSWHVWVYCACDCKVICVFAGCTVMSISKFYSIMTCPECPVPAIARWAESATQPWHVLSALCLRLQGALCLWLQGALCLRLQGDLGLCWVHSHVNLQVLLNHDMSWVPCACDFKMVWVFAACTVMSICKFYSIMTCPCAWDCKVVCVFVGCTAMSICKFYSIMTCLECLPAIARWSVYLLGAQSNQFISSVQPWHVWMPRACDCKVVCVLAGCTVNVNL